MTKRLAVVDKTLCQPDKCQLECISVCPVNKLNQECIVLSEGREIAVISAPLCTGCGLCIKKCPFHAISIVNLVAPVEEKLTYSYGENAFKLYGLILPKKGIIGIIGDNGAGKTTNVKLLEQHLSPQRFYSKEVEAFFQSPPTVVVKPQELIAAKLGTVGALFEKSASPRLSALRKIFDLEALWHHHLDQLSGGELQRVYITAALMKQKGLYVLDEPFAFLDYAYRIRLVEYLRKEFSEKYVLLVDHDLSLMSYACDYAYILFGEPGVYGIVSQPYATDRAINQFLDGFLEGENVRFRDGSLRFKRHVAEEKKDEAVTLEKTSVQLGGGQFIVENPFDVTLYKGEIVGVVGRNGIGKSTLVQHYASKLNASIKPQILKRSDESVLPFLQQDTPFQQRFLNEMGLKRLEFFTLEQLSGGELQKVLIFNALASQGSVFVLDEPTNMMDVRGRVALSKLLRDKTKEDCAVLVVDHDLEFVLNTVDRLLVLEGIPSKHGRVAGVFSKDQGVARLLADFDLTYRRDPKTHRLKLNKAGSVKHRELKESGRFVE